MSNKEMTAEEMKETLTKMYVMRLGQLANAKARAEDLDDALTELEIEHPALSDVCAPDEKDTESQLQLTLLLCAHAAYKQGVTPDGVKGILEEIHQRAVEDAQPDVMIAELKEAGYGMIFKYTLLEGLAAQSNDGAKDSDNAEESEGD